jgi:putative restriction endonuclease
VHWLFDRGLVSLEDDGRLLLARSLPPESLRLFPEARTAAIPEDPALRPHPEFLAYHRSTFKGG